MQKLCSQVDTNPLTSSDHITDHQGPTLGPNPRRGSKGHHHCLQNGPRGAGWGGVGRGGVGRGGGGRAGRAWGGGGAGQGGAGVGQGRAGGEGVGRGWVGGDGVGRGEDGGIRRPQPNPAPVLNPV